VTIGREPEAGVQIRDSELSEQHLRAEPVNGLWRIIDSGPSGMFVDGHRQKAVTVTDKTMVRFGDPKAGTALTFEIVRAPRTSEERHSDTSASQDDDSPNREPDPAMARAGAAVAARRRELGISQRSLAAGGIINAGALIAFEKGRSWPRKRTQAKLERVLQWPAGSIARIRHGQHDIADVAMSVAPPGDSAAATPSSSADSPATLIAQAIVAAVDACGLAIAALPSADDLGFIERATPILADLRQLEAIAVRATHISRITPELIKALGTVRRHYDELMMAGANADGAPLAQRLYAARRQANLSTLETAQAAGVAELVIRHAESGQAVPAGDVDVIETLIREITSG
jgi:ribosome-binding protein aMBF1 (putative translation factor)